MTHFEMIFRNIMIEESRKIWFPAKKKLLLLDNHCAIVNRNQSKQYFQCPKVYQLMNPVSKAEILLLYHVKRNA